MAKQPNFVATERVDLNDFIYASATYPYNANSDFARSVLGSGVMNGFQVRILDQAIPNKGRLEVYNGRALDWGGQFINAETGTISEQIVLSGKEQEYWIEIELLFINTDPDARALWDALIANTSPAPNGQEVSVPRIPTRRVPAWRIKRPMRSNPAAKRSDGGYNPVGFSPSTENAIPIAVIRTNSSGHISFGNPDEDDFGNAITTVTTAEGTRFFVPQPGMDEPTQTDLSGYDVVYGFKNTDQRPRFFSPLLPAGPLGFVPPGEIVGSTWGDHWITDMASMFDHLATQIGQIKNGSGASDIGQYHDGVIDSLAPDLDYIVIKELYDNSPLNSPMVLDPDQLIGTTFMITSGHWAGFYAEIRNNERTDLSGNTKVWLGRKSKPPEWKEFPVGNPTCRVVQHRQVNWLNPPTPDTGNRGLNALDLEVASARYDWWSSQSFTQLKTRIDAHKYASLTVAPDTTPDTETGAPADASHPRADVFWGNGSIMAAVKAVAESRGGLIHFRQGTYDFVDREPTQTIFDISNANGVIFQGDGKNETILQYNNVSAPVESRTLFSLSSCTDIIFKDMTIRSTGNPLIFNGCSRVWFINCDVEGTFVDSDTPTVDLGTATSFVFDSCQFYLTGRGMVATSCTNSLFHNCQFYQNGAYNYTYLNQLISLGTVAYSKMHHCYLTGYASSFAIGMSSVERSMFDNNIMEVTVNNSAGHAIFYVAGEAKETQFKNLTLKNANVVDNSTPAGIIAGSMLRCLVDDTIIAGINGYIHVDGDFQHSSICNARGYCTSNATAIAIGGFMFGSIIDKNSIYVVGGGTSTRGILVSGNIQKSAIRDNTILGTSEIGSCISLTGTSILDLIATGNQGTFTQIGIGITNLSDGNRIFIKDNKIEQASDYAYRLTLTGNLQYLQFDGNQATNSSGVGLSIASPGHSIAYSSFQKNILHATTRALEIWATSGGSLSFSSFLGNNFKSDSHCAVAFGTTESAGTTTVSNAISPFVISGTLFKNNICITSTGASFYSVFFPQLEQSIVDNNYMSGGAGSATLYVERGATDCSLSHNYFGSFWDVGAHCIQIKGTTIEKTRIHGNFCYTKGNNNHSIYINQDNPGTNRPTALSICNNLLYNITVVASGSGYAATGLRFDACDYCTITGNTSVNHAYGFWMRTSTHCMVSGNQCFNNSEKYMDLGGNTPAASTYMKGGDLSVLAPALSLADDFGGAWDGDGDTNNNNVRVYNVGW